MENEWTRGEIDKEKIIEEKWWKQQGHNWTHYLGTVPWLWMLNGKKNTRYAGGWGLVNSMCQSNPYMLKVLISLARLVHEGIAQALLI